MKKLLVILLVVLIYSLSQAQGGHKGKVLNTMDVEGYTYAEIENEGKKKWIASTHFDAKMGDTIEASEGILMTDFYSKTLKKTFKEIYFVTYVKVINEKKAADKPIDVNLSDFKKNKDKFNGKSVRFKALVTKVSNNIMGRNWLHVTGEGEKDSAIDIVVSTTDKVNVADRVIIEGVFSIDKNIGGGYQFPYFIEDGKVTAR